MLHLKYLDLPYVWSLENYNGNEEDVKRRINLGPLSRRKGAAWAGYGVDYSRA